jgi:alpha-glucoside transport system permease protein
MDARPGTKRVLPEGAIGGEEPPISVGGGLLATVGRLLVSVLVPVVAFAVLRQGFIFLRDSAAPKGLIVAVAILWGVGGVALLYWVANWFVERLPERFTRRIQPYVFVGPAVAILFWYLAAPTVRTLLAALKDQTSTDWVGLKNFVFAFTDRTMLVTFRNNLMWMVVGSLFSVTLGLLVAALADRSRFERTAKALVFLPMAISFVGAGVIWNFMYEVRDVADPQIGLLNALWVGLFNGQPQAWTAFNQPWNNLFLIVIVIWLQTGYAMVLFSAAIKGVPADQVEAAKVDGATELQSFFRVVIPSIWGTIVTVTTTVVIFTLKIFDVVWVMTGGQFGTDVIATQFYRQYFVANDNGRGSAIAIVLLVAVIPVMVYNLRQFSQREAFK